MRVWALLYLRTAGACGKDSHETAEGMPRPPNAIFETRRVPVLGRRRLSQPDSVEAQIRQGAKDQSPLVRRAFAASRHWAADGTIAMAHGLSRASRVNVSRGPKLTQNAETRGIARGSLCS